MSHSLAQVSSEAGLAKEQPAEPIPVTRYGVGGMLLPYVALIASMMWVAISRLGWQERVLVAGAQRADAARSAGYETMQSTATQSCGDPLSFGSPWISEVQRKGRADQVRLGLVQPTVDGRCRLARKTLTNPATAVVLLEELIRDVGSELAR